MFRSNRATRMTVADLRARLADLPDWAAVEVLVDDGGPEGLKDEYDPLLTYADGVLTIDSAESW